MKWFLSMMPDDVRDNIDCEGFGNRWDDQPLKYEHKWTIDSMPGILGSKKQTVMFKPMLGLVLQSKLLPVKYAPIVIELELCNSKLDPIISPDKFNSVALAGAQGGTPTFTNTNTGSDWSIENI